MKKRYLYILSASVLTISTGIFLLRDHHEKTDGFSLSTIQSHLPYNPEYETLPLTLDEQREVACAFSQDYTYLGRGGQSFSFVSNDQKYVIKFINHKKRKEPFYANYLTFKPFNQWIQKKRSIKNAKQKRDFLSYKIAKDELQEQTGMIFAHLNKTKNLRKHLFLIDKAKRKFSVNLDDYEFLLQKKANMIYPQITFFMENHQVDKAQSLIKNILSTMIYRSKKGIYDDDAKIHRNFGCIEDQILFIDVGRFTKASWIVNDDEILKDLLMNTKKFSEWLSIHHPELNEFLNDSINHYRDL